MFREYTTPEMEIVEFETEDIITTSVDDGDKVDYPITPIP